MKTAREYAHDLVNWDGMNHCGPRTHSPTCDKGTEMFAPFVELLGDAERVLRNVVDRHPTRREDDCCFHREDVADVERMIAKLMAQGLL